MTYLGCKRSANSLEKISFQGFDLREAQLLSLLELIEACSSLKNINLDDILESQLSKLSKATKFSHHLKLSFAE